MQEYECCIHCDHDEPSGCSVPLTEDDKCHTMPCHVMPCPWCFTPGE